MFSGPAKVFQRQHKAPCADCPWRRNAVKGWLGPLNIYQWLSLARDYWHKMYCHTRAQPGGDHWECVGGAIFRANTKVMPFPTKPLLKMPENKINVFASPEEFEVHHRK
jgi:hypothetical protein